ncbi:hypothetical protein K8352_17210 [Flavobacteriaceae bacterium F89]|uniref:Uncharacterized protein n=1 Tax=Cerina litoralis TaxID=2874477 RepID=A0AAE3EX52_9FLAO|nr:hypothetical protein [Cerina litoralis]MCG2462503.1 hypothetical protein [Cerina litoralis]
MMKYKILALLVIIGLVLQNCTKENKWAENYDINFPIPEISSVSKTVVKVKDTISMEGIFNAITRVTIGGGTATIESISIDSTSMNVIVTKNSASGALMVENVYKKVAKYPTELVVEGGGTVVAPPEVVIFDFTTKGTLPDWTPSTWTETRTATAGYDLNDNILPPEGYDHYYAWNDIDWHQPGGGNAPYGYFNTNNDGAGFDISFYDEPYISVLINTGDYQAYLSYSETAGSQIDFNPGQAPGGNFANLESGMFMETKRKWVWYSFKLSDVLGADVPNKLESSGLLIRNPWAGGDPYPGFQLNIAKMVITDGPIQKPLITVFDFTTANNADIPTWTASTWVEAQPFEEQGFDLNVNSGVAMPAGYSHYYSMNDHSVNKVVGGVGVVNPAGGGNVPYGFITTTNKGAGFSDAIEGYDNLYFNYLINTGSYVAYADYAKVADDGSFSWADLNADFTANGKMANNEDHFNKTNGKWMWYSFSVAKIYGGVDKIPADLSTMGMFIRNPWIGPDPYPGFELNIAKVVLSNGPLQN